MNIEQTKDDHDGDEMEGAQPNTCIIIIMESFVSSLVKMFPLSLTFSFLRQNKRGSIGAN